MISDKLRQELHNRVEHLIIQIEQAFDPNGPDFDFDTFRVDLRAMFRQPSNQVIKDFETSLVCDKYAFTKQAAEKQVDRYLNPSVLRAMTKGE